MTHTQGPWVVREPEGDALHEIYAENGGDLICFPVWTHNQKANIPLIAAAPELLETLKVAANAIDYGQAQVDSEEDRYKLRKWLVQVKRVIAKAEGRTDD
jgi:hypothetical protein